MVAVALMVACSWYRPIEAVAERQVDAGLKRALVTFATARALNAAISAVQGTEIAVQPFGFGMTLSVGQVLDPVNDLVEQFSTVMLAASVAFGIQKVLLVAASSVPVSALLTVVAAVWAALSLRGTAPSSLGRFVAILLLVRFAIPVAVIGSDQVFQQLQAREYEQSQGFIAATSRTIEQLPPAQAAGGAGKGLLDKLADRLTAPIEELKARYQQLKASAEQATEKIVSLIVIFLLQTIVAPVILLLALRSAVWGLLRASEVR